MRIDLLEETLDRLDAEGRTPKFIYTIPSSRTRRGVTMSLERRRALVRLARRARAARARGQPVRAAALRGRPAADAVLARRRRVRDLPRHVLEDPLAGAAAGLGRGPAAGAGASSNLGKQAADLCSSPLSQYFVATYFAAARLARVPARRCVELYRRRRDVMLDALAEHFPREATWTRAAGRPVHLGAAARLHRHHRPARRARCASTSRSCRAARRTSTAAAARRCG